MRTLTPTQPLTHRYWLYSIGFITVLGLFLRLWGLDSKSLWGDELFTLAHACGTLINTDVLKALGQTVSAETTLQFKALLWGDAEHFFLEKTLTVLRYNNHPPLFFTFMNGYLWLLNHYHITLTPFLIRLPAAVFGALCIPAMARLGQQLHSKTLGLISALLMAFSGYQLYHSQDARPYTLETLLAILFISTLWHLKQTPESNAPVPLGRWLMVVLLGIAGLYTHYFFIPVLILGFAIGFITPQGNGQWFKGLPYAYGAIGLGFLPWLSMLKEQLGFMSTLQHYTQGLWNPWSLPEVLLRHHLELFIPGMGWAKPILIAILLLPLGHSLYQHFYSQRKEPPKRRFQIPSVVALALLWLLCVDGFQIAFDLLSQSNTVSVRRYLMLAGPAVLFLFAIAVHYGVHLYRQNQVTVQGKIPITLILTALSIIITFNIRGIQQETILRNPDYQRAIRSVTQSSHQPFMLITNRLEHAIGLSFYATKDVPLLVFPVQQVGSIAEKNALVDFLTKRLATAPHSKSEITFIWVDEAPSLSHHTEDILKRLGYKMLQQKDLQKIHWGQWVRRAV